MTEKKPEDKIPERPNYDKFTWGPGDLVIEKASPKAGKKPGKEKVKKEK